MNCSRCNKFIPHVCKIQSPEDWNYQREDALVIKFYGGYGMFIDPFFEEKDPIGILCYACAIELVTNYPWIKRTLGIDLEDKERMEYYG